MKRKTEEVIMHEMREGWLEPEPRCLPLRCRPSDSTAFPSSDLDRPLPCFGAGRRMA